MKIKPLKIRFTKDIEEWKAENPESFIDNGYPQPTPIGKGVSSGQALLELRKKQSTSFAVDKEQEQQREVLFTMMSKISELENENKMLRGKLADIKKLL